MTIQEGGDVSAKSLLSGAVTELKEGGMPADDGDSTVASVGFMSKESETPQDSVIEDTTAAGRIASEEKAASEAATSKTSAASQDAKTIEEITITDDKGRRKVTIDHSDKAKTKQAYQLAAGMHKAFRERDEARNEIKKTTDELSALKTKFGLLENAWKTEGLAGVIKLVTEGKSSLEAEAQAYLARKAKRDSATPAELSAMDNAEKLAQLHAEMESLRKENATFKSTVDDSVKLAERQKAESIVMPAFHKYRFEGKLGDEADEQRFDRMMWRDVTDQLDQLKDQGIAVTPEIIDQHFKDAHLAVTRRIKATADKKVMQSIENKAAQAKENVQRRVSQSMSGDSKTREEAEKLMESGNLRSFFGNLSKYGKYFNS
jgi:hypothetical protein